MLFRFLRNELLRSKTATVLRNPDPLDNIVLWFIDCGFSGIELIPYIIANVLIMTAVMERSHNLFNATWIHI
jgi:hypothetical protein